MPEGEEPTRSARSLPDWPAVPGGAGALERGARARLEAGDPVELRPRPDRGVERRIGVPFDLSSSPRTRSRTSPRTATGSGSSSDDGERGRHVHVAASHFHDIVPANELGLPSVWINRLGEEADPSRRASCPTWRGSPTRSTSSSRVTALKQLTLRAPRLGEASVVAELSNAESQRVRGSDDTDVGVLATAWTTPGLDLERDAVVAVDPEGRLVGLRSFRMTLRTTTGSSGCTCAQTRPTRRSRQR